MRYFFALLIILSFSSSLYAKVLTFGVIPQQSQTELLNNWQPLISYLEKATGEQIVLKTEPTIEKFLAVLYAGGYDIAYMSPYHYLIAHKKQGYTAQVRDEKNLSGILVVNKKSGITDLSMISGKRFLFSSPDAFAAALLIKYELLKVHNIDINSEKNIYYVNSQDSVYKGVARGIGDVGGGIERTLEDLSDIKTKESLMILYKTKTYPSHPFAFKPSVADQTQMKITKALLELPPYLTASLKMKHIIKINDSEFNNIQDFIKFLP